MRDGAPPDINDLVQTSDGYLWLATANGLYRFDGVQFERYVPPAGADLPSDDVDALLALPDGGLWMSYTSGGASLLKKGVLTDYDGRAGLGSGAIEMFARAPDGDVWAAAHSGLYHLKGTTWLHIGSEANISCAAITSLMFQEDGTLWISCENTILYRRPHETQFQPTRLSFDDSVNLTPGSGGTIWTSGIAGRVVPYRLTSDERFRPGLAIRVRSMYSLVDHLGRLWIASTAQGLRCITPSTRNRGLGSDLRLPNSASFTKEDGLTSNETGKLIEDREGNIWVTTTAGLDRFRRTKLISVALPSGTSGPAIVADEHGGILVSTGAVAPGIERVTTAGINALEKAPAYLTSTYRDQDNSFWFGGLKSLWHLVHRHFVPIALPPDLSPRTLVQSIVTSPEGDLWVSFSRDSLYRRRAGRWLKFGAQQGWPGLSPLTMQKDALGRLWFAYGQNLIVVLTGDHIETLSSKNGLNLGKVTATAGLGESLWVGGESGLQLFDQGRFVNVQDQTLQFKNVSGVVQSMTGDLWLSESAGAVRITKAEVEHFKKDHTYRVHSQLFGILDGSPGIPYQQSRLPSVVEGTDGILWFTTGSGLSHIDPRNLVQNTVIPTVLIGSIKADQVLYQAGSGLRLPKGTNNIQVNYTALSLSMTERVRFRYKLEGFDKEWLDAGTRRQAFYSQLPPGPYRFRVLGSNDDGLWNQVGATTLLIIPPTFLQSMLFKLICAAVLLSSLWSFYLMRLRQVTSQVRTRLYDRLAERERIARDLHDTFFQGIQGLLLRFQTGTRQLANDQPTKALFEETLQQSDEVMLQGRELVLDLRSSTRDSNDLSGALANVGLECRSSSLAAFKVVVIGTVRAIHPIVHEELYRLGKEAITNAFHHADARRIEGELDYETACIRLSIRDDGIGLDPKIRSDGFRTDHWGLPGMRERASKIGAHLDIWSRKDGGTEIVIKVPASVAYRRISTHSRLKDLLSRADGKGQPS